MEFASAQLDELGLPVGELAGVGLAVPGVLDSREYVLREVVNLPGWHGEPLLQMDRLVDLSRKMRDVCTRADCKYTASIVSNGYLLDRETAERLKEQQVADAQITLDGPRDVHDERRPLVGGGGVLLVQILSPCAGQHAHAGRPIFKRLL